MAATLTRVTTFVPATPILSAEVNAELNQLVNLLNSTSSNIKLSVKVSDAGDAPLEVNQLSTGPIQKWFQAGVEKARTDNDGTFRMLALRFTAGFPNILDLSGNELIKFGVSANPGNELQISGAGTGNGPILGASGDDTNVDIRILPKGSGLVKIQSGAPIAGNDAANKQYVDDQRTRWMVSWLYTVLPTAVETTESVQRLIVPDVTGAFIEDIVVVWAAGSDSGASNVFTIKKRNSAGTLGTDVGTIDVNTPAQNALNVNNITDYAITAGDQIYPLLTTRNTASEQMVTVCIRGYQKVKTT